MKMISVIIPVYNAEAHISKCLDSVLNQNYENVQAVVINDGSTDGTAEVIRYYCKKDSRIKYLEKKNGGVSNARNKGLEIADGEYITFVDADDYIDPDYCGAMLGGMEKYDTDICSCRAINHHLANENDDRYLKEDENELVIPVKEFSFFDDSLPKAVCCVMFKKKIIENVKFDPSLYVAEDTLFLAKALHNAGRITVLHRNLYHYIMYDESTSHGGYDKKKRTEFIAWRRVARVFKDMPGVYETCRARYADRCLKVIRKYHFHMGVSEVFYRKMLQEYRKNLKYIVRCLMKKHRVSDIINAAAYVMFAIFPSAYPKYYKFRYHEIS